MKLIVKANDKTVFVNCKGEPMKLMAALQQTTSEVLHEIAKNEQGFDFCKRIMITAINAMNYDGSINMDLVEEVKDE